MATFTDVGSVLDLIIKSDGDPIAYVDVPFFICRIRDDDLQIVCDRLRTDSWYGIQTMQFVFDAIEDYHGIDQWHSEVEFNAQEIREMNDRLAARLKYQLSKISKRTVESTLLTDGNYGFRYSYHKGKKN